MSLTTIDHKLLNVKILHRGDHNRKSSPSAHCCDAQDSLTSILLLSQIWNLHLLLIYSPANENHRENMYMYLWGANFLAWQRKMFIRIQLRLRAQCQLCTLTPLIFSWLMKLKLFPRPKMRSFPSSLLPASIFVAAGAGHDYQRVLVLKIVTSSGNFDGERMFLAVTLCFLLANKTK